MTLSAAAERVTIPAVREAKKHRRLVALTALDAPSADWCVRAGVDIVLVGDSLGMVSLGFRDTTHVSMEAMVQATEACVRGMGEAPRPLLVADLPDNGLSDPVRSSRRLLEAGAAAVKIECHEMGMKAIEAARSAGIEVMAHVGLLPQEAAREGGYKLKGVTEEESNRILEVARRAEGLGCFSCVIEKVTRRVGKLVTDALSIPTIGIGAGPDCDGQILVLYDMLGIFERFHPKFVRRYAAVGTQAVSAISQYAEDVRNGSFPSGKESFES
ncbi:MAG: 3-methyl-2-oxobutanoate hydroxymethyltransferase [Candidatus Hydrogenedentota bacterium]